MSAERVVEFWFGTPNEGFSDEATRKRWFTPSAEFDREIESEFGNLLEDARSGLLDHWLTEPVTCLAYIIVTDQFPRNIHRGTAEAFAWDQLALNAARNGIRGNLDRQLDYDQRSFFYMPFEHSEDLVDQHTAVGLFTKLRDDTPKGLRHLTGETLRFALQHRDIIERFGRFPHRNKVLNRPSSEEEVAFAAGGGFGQS